MRHVSVGGRGRPGRRELGGLTPIDEIGDLVDGAVELAFAQARRDAGAHDAPPPPAALRPILHFVRLPPTVRRTVRQVLDSDDDFRRRVAAALGDETLDRPSWLYLTRPDGWQDELELLAAAEAEAREDEREIRDEQRAGRRVEQLEQALDRLRTELGAERRARADAEAVAAAERSARSTLQRELDELSARADALDAERARAVRSLKEAEATSTARLQELREVRGELAAALEREASAPPAPPRPTGHTTGTSGVDPAAAARDAALAAAVERASEAAATLSEALAAAAGALDTPPESAPAAAAGPSLRGSRSKEPPAAGERPPRRTPIRLRRGVHEGSVEGLEQLLSVSGVWVVVDGYNVAMEGWPALDAAAQRDSLVAGLGRVASLSRATIHVVFDGDADGGRPAVQTPLPVRVHFSPAEVEADDVILSMVAELPTDVPVVVVSSDGRVANGARRLGANAVRSTQLLELLRR